MSEGRPLPGSSLAAKTWRVPRQHARVTCAHSSLQIHAGDIDRGAMPLHHHNTGVGDVIKLAVAVQVVADNRVGWDTHVFIQNRAADAGAPADVAVVENNGILDVGVRIDADAAANYRSPDQAAR